MPIQRLMTAKEKEEFTEAFTRLNNEILRNTRTEFDLSNFISTEKIGSFINDEGSTELAAPLNYNLPASTKFKKRGGSDPPAFRYDIPLNDVLRKQLEDVLAKAKEINPEEVAAILAAILRRSVLYHGSECELMGKIDVEGEYNLINSLFVNEYMHLIRSPKSSIQSLQETWHKAAPTIVFFSCHGDNTGLYMQDEAGKCKHYSNINFLEFFSGKTANTKCTILSACESDTLGKLLTDYSETVVCINKKVNITSARDFTKHFVGFLNLYSTQMDNLYQKAFEYAKTTAKFEGYQDSNCFEFLRKV